MEKVVIGQQWAVEPLLMMIIIIIIIIMVMIHAKVVALV
jgi:hypothetical protein